MRLKISNRKVKLGRNVQSRSNPKTTMYTKAKDYIIDLEARKSANLHYSAMSSSSRGAATSAYDSNLVKFDESVKTIKFTK